MPFVKGRIVKLTSKMQQILGEETKQLRILIVYPSLLFSLSNVRVNYRLNVHRPLPHISSLHPQSNPPLPCIPPSQLTNIVGLSKYKYCSEVQLLEAAKDTFHLRWVVTSIIQILQINSRAVFAVHASW